MKKRIAILTLALMLCGWAMAEVYEGTTAALSTVAVTAEAGDILKALNARAGDRVAEGDALMALEGERVFAAQDGAISLIDAQPGDEVDGTVLELAPTERYLIYCTVSNAYQSGATTLVHSGETVYARCTSDGTHRAIGMLTQIDGEEYRVITLGGELYIGETVYLYRDADFTASQRIGIGTVVSSDTVPYSSAGRLSALHVGEGDQVERGQLLYELDGGTVTAPVSGIVTAVSPQKGDRVEADQAVAEIVPDGQVCVELRLDEAEAARVCVGQRAQLIPAGRDDGDALDGTVIDVAWVAEDGAYTVRVLPEDGDALPLGLSVAVRL